MQIIKEISERIEEELNDSEWYIKKAIAHKPDEKAVADIYKTISEEELRHSTMLHNQGVRLINEYKSKGETVPASMQAVYDYLHEKHIAHANQIRMYQKQYEE